MKSGILCGALFAGVQSSPVDDVRRYKQWEKVMAVYNQDFDSKNFWTYGCNCLQLGDRPLSGTGYGGPVDALDAVCKRYKECLKCAKEEYPDIPGGCEAEFTNYGFDSANGEVTCKNNPNRGAENGCKRKVCECDKQFAKEYVGAKTAFDEKYHQFYGPFDAEKQCVKNPGSERQCCGLKNSFSVLYNTGRYECCAGGDVKEIGTC